MGGPLQDDFLNAAVLVSWEEGDLLEALQAIERDLGRERDVRWGPRTIDLDILWIEGRTINDPPRLVVPHPRLHERAFALAPLLDVVPDAIDPRSKRQYAVPTDQELVIRADSIR